MNPTPYQTWRLFIVHAAAKLAGVQIKVDTIPFGAGCGFRNSARGVECLRQFNQAVRGSNAT